MAMLKDMIAAIHKAGKPQNAFIASDWQDVDRIPTGIFPFDLATGGGFPRGKISFVYGYESSNKTNVCLQAIRQEQQIHPDKYCIFVDVENSFDANWAKKQGVDINRLVILKPEGGEQSVDYIEASLKAEDVSLVVVDSIAMMIPTSEADNTADRVQVGGNALLIGKMMRKCTTALLQEAANNRYPTLICINQLRMKIGVMHGNPETTPGGQAKDFMSGLTIRLNGKDIIEKTIHPDLPVYKETGGIIKKWKVPVAARTFTFNYTLIPHMVGSKHVAIGEVLAWNTMLSYMKQVGMLTKGDKGGWVFEGETFATQEAVFNAFWESPEDSRIYYQKIIRLVMESLGTEADV